MHATFGAGCFWGVEMSFRRLGGVTDAAVGYAGGHTENPTYQDICSHGTGHAEVVEVEYDPAQISYESLLDAFSRCTIRRASIARARTSAINTAR